MVDRGRGDLSRDGRGRFRSTARHGDPGRVRGRHRRRVQPGAGAGHAVDRVGPRARTASSDRAPLSPERPRLPARPGLRGARRGVGPHRGHRSVTRTSCRGRERRICGLRRDTGPDAGRLTRHEVERGRRRVDHWSMHVSGEEPRPEQAPSPARPRGAARPHGGAGSPRNDLFTDTSSGRIERRSECNPWSSEPRIVLSR